MLAILYHSLSGCHTDMIFVVAMRAWSLLLPCGHDRCGCHANMIVVVAMRTQSWWLSCGHDLCGCHADVLDSKILIYQSNHTQQMNLLSWHHLLTWLSRTYPENYQQNYTVSRRPSFPKAIAYCSNEEHSHETTIKS